MTRQALFENKRKKTAIRGPCWWCAFEWRGVKGVSGSRTRSAGRRPSTERVSITGEAVPLTHRNDPNGSGWWLGGALPPTACHVANEQAPSGGALVGWF